MAKIALVNIGTIVSGDWRNPFISGDALYFEKGFIKEVGSISSENLDAADMIVDVDGMTVIPGLIDSHVHTTFGDYTPRQKVVGFLESYLHGGITSVISASEIHVEGRPSDPAGIKALAIAAQRCYANYRPGGMRVYGGSIIMEPGLTEADFAELAEQGVWLAKVGFGKFDKPVDVTPSVRAAQKYGIKVMCHTGGASVPGSSPINGDDLLTMLPDISGHVNGGPVALSDEDLTLVVNDTEIALQIVQAGNIRSSLKVIELVEKKGCFDRLLAASDTPTGTGMMPLGTIKTIVEMTCLAQIEPERMIAASTGNAAKIYGLDSGFLQPGKAADITIIDCAQGGVKDTALEGMSNGDIPAIAAVFSDGIPRFVKKSRNTPPPTRTLNITRNEIRAVYDDETTHQCC